ncbi:hypothetical protein MKX08_000152 [Trichoderma sp. CBMAI-0020]|nr:hypothetical protein MKX08_000152 [Trichoderma sp. CBMAI-0020]
MFSVAEYFFQPIENVIAFFSTSVQDVFRKCTLKLQIRQKTRDVAQINQAQSQHPSKPKHPYANRGFTIAGVLYLMNEHIRNRKAMKDKTQPRAEWSQIRNENLPTEMENDRLSSSLNNLSLAQQHVEKQRTYHSENDSLRDPDTEYEKVDMLFIVKNRGLFDVWELRQIEQLVCDTDFRNWMTLAKSGIFIYSWRWTHPSPISGVLSPLSTASASLASSLNNHRQFVCGVWFCSRHVEFGNDEISAMLVSLIDQICQQYSFGNRHVELPQDHETEGAYLERHGNKALFNHLHALIKMLPSEVTLVLIIDEINIFYQNKEFVDGPYIGDKLARLQMTDEIKMRFQEANRILHVEKV